MTHYTNNSFMNFCYQPCLPELLWSLLKGNIGAADTISACDQYLIWCTAAVKLDRNDIIYSLYYANDVSYCISDMSHSN